MKALLIVLFVALLTACSTTSLDEGGRMVRMISPDYSGSCEFLGVFEATEIQVIGDGSTARLNALNNIRNQIAREGGNAVTLASGATGMVTGSVQAAGFRCATFSQAAELQHKLYEREGFGVTPSDGRSSGDDPYVQFGDTKRMIRESDCIGAVVNGKCHGSTIDGDFDNKTCHGTIVNGECIGAKF